MGSGKPGLAMFAGRPLTTSCPCTLEPGADTAPPLTDSVKTVKRTHSPEPNTGTGRGIGGLGVPLGRVAVDDDREHADRDLHEIFGSMRDIAAEGE